MVVPRSGPRLSACNVPPLAETKVEAIHKPKPDPAPASRLTLPAEARFAQLFFLIRCKPASLIAHRENHVVILTTARDRDRGSSRRILRRVLQYLADGLLDQNGIHMDQRDVGLKVEGDPVRREPARFLLHGCVDDIGRVGPGQLWPNSLGADTGRVEQVPNLAVKLTGLIVDRFDQIVRLAIIQDGRHLVENAAGAKD